jgi:tetratricopeptide (TPR) repeat protein
MNSAIANPQGRILMVLSSAVFAAGLTYFAVRNALSAHYRDNDWATRADYEHAVRLEPTDPRNWYLLGRSYLYDLEQPDPLKAIEALGRSVKLDPYSAEALLDLANAYDGEGDATHALEAYRAAQRVYPLSADVCWSYGNLLLRRGQQDAAFAQIRKAVELEPKRGAEAFALAMRVQPDVNILLDQVVPADTAVYLPIVHTLSDAGEIATAQAVWKRLLALHQKVPIQDTVNYVDAVNRKLGPSESTRAWQEAVSIMQNPPPPDPGDSLIWDGGFESAYDGGGYAWHFNRNARELQISFSTTEKHSGDRSIRVLFNGRKNLNFEDVCHNIAPQEGQTYLLTGWVKTQSLTSSEGIRLQIFAFAQAGNVTVMTDDARGTQDWKQLRLTWTAPQGANFGTVCVRRLMSDMPGGNIQGAAWIDDISLTPVRRESATP